MRVESVTATQSIARIPSEILTKVFYLSLTCQSSPFSRTAAPLNVSQTCRFWRSTALSSRHLWSTLHATVECHELGSDRSLRILSAWCTILSMWIHRSRNCQLNFRILVNMGEADMSAAVHQKSEEMVTMILQEKGRWGSSSFDFCRLHLTASLQIKLAKLSSVSDLTFEFKRSDVGQVGTASTFTSLEVVGASNMETHSDKNNSNNISKLAICHEGMGSETYLKMCLNSLCSNLNLTSLFFYLLPTVSEVDRSRSLSPAVYLPHLRELIIESSSLLDCNIFESITAPSLERLDLDAFTREHLPTPRPQFLLDFLHRSRPPISRLGVHGDYLDGDLSLMQLLRILPTIRKLSLSGCELSEAFWSALTITESRGRLLGAGAGVETLCPNLKEIDLSPYCSWDTECDALVARMLVSRWRNSKDFEASIDLEGFGDDNPYTDLKSDAALKQCVEEGFILYI